MQPEHDSDHSLLTSLKSLNCKQLNYLCGVVLQLKRNFTLLCTDNHCLLQTFYVLQFMYKRQYILEML